MQLLYFPFHLRQTRNNFHRQQTHSTCVEHFNTRFKKKLQVEVCSRSFVTVNIKLRAKFRCSFIRFVRLASFVSLARTSPYKKNLTKQTKNVTRITKILKCCNKKRATSRHAMRYGVTTHMMVWWFYVILITQNTAVTGVPKCITFITLNLM